MGSVDVEIASSYLSCRNIIGFSLSNRTANDSKTIEKSESEESHSNDGSKNPAPLAAQELITVLRGIAGGGNRGRACNFAANLCGDGLLSLTDHVGCDGLDVRLRTHNCGRGVDGNRLCILVETTFKYWLRGLSKPALRVSKGDFRRSSKSRLANNCVSNTGGCVSSAG